jgi:hypothetical protein
MYQASHEALYLPARRILSFFGTITLMLSLVTIAVTVRCMTNFNKGLKIHVTSDRLARTLLEDYEMEMYVIDRHDARRD